MIAPSVSVAMARNHERVLHEASRMVRERGTAGVSVPEVMAAAGLTHGGFYKHFASKDDLLAQAGAAAFADRQASLDDLLASAPDPGVARERLIADYLSTRHRDHPADGCALAALAADSALREDDDPLHLAYATGLHTMIQSLTARRNDDAQDDAQDDAGHLADLATMVGALLIARATTGTDTSERVLAAARERLLGH